MKVSDLSCMVIFIDKGGENVRENLIGNTYGRLTVVDTAEDLVSASGYHTVMWKCRCECGELVTVRGKSLKGGVTKSCGCFQRDEMSERASKHGGFGSRLYAVWNSMRQRCNNENHRAYENYGGRGISICKEWDDFSKFREWAASSGYDETAPRGKYTLDRVDVNGDYSPSNCRWVDMRSQANNRRCSIQLEHDGETLNLHEWAERVGLDYTTIWKRYSKGLPADEILRQ